MRRRQFAVALHRRIDVLVANETGHEINRIDLLSADEEAGLIFLPMGGPSPDFFGGQRDGLGYYGSSVVALDAASGEVRWHFQTVHHDL